MYQIKVQKYRLRILYAYPLHGECIIENLTWSEVCEKFKYYVDCCLEFPDLSVRCINIFKGKKCIKLFENH